MLSFHFFFSKWTTLKINLSCVGPVLNAGERWAKFHPCSHKGHSSKVPGWREEIRNTSASLPNDSAAKWKPRENRPLVWGRESRPQHTVRHCSRPLCPLVTSKSLCWGITIIWDTGILAFFFFFEVLHSGIILGLEKNWKTENFYTVHPTSPNITAAYALVGVLQRNRTGRRHTEGWIRENWSTWCDSWESGIYGARVPVGAVRLAGQSRKSWHLQPEGHQAGDFPPAWASQPVSCSVLHQVAWGPPQEGKQSTRLSLRIQMSISSNRFSQEHPE